MTADLEAAIAALIESLEVERAELVRELARVDRSLGLQRAALADIRGEEPPAAPRSGGRIDNARSRLVQRVLAEAKEPLSRVSIQSALEALGHAEEVDDISSTLTYLRRSDPPLVVRHEGNRWWVPQQD